jgi:hypothetical protein
MRILAFIPAFLLLFSNVYFIEKIPMEKMLPSIKPKGDCCMQQEKMQHTCIMEKQGESAVPSKSSSKGCQQPEPTCICTYCLQFTGIAQISSFQLSPIITLKGLIGFLELKRTNPHVVSPWQPPDVS